MSKKTSKTFCLAFIRRRISNTFKSEALRAALLAELNGGEDAALVVQMIERVRPVVDLPTQAVAPVPNQATPQLNGGEDAALMVQMVERERPVVDPPTQAVAPVPNQATPQSGQVSPPVTRQPPPPVADGNTAASAVEILDSEDELVQEMLLTPVRERRMREQLQSWRSSSSD